jgi:hypothetical protein
VELRDNADLREILDEEQAAAWRERMGRGG